MNLTDIFIKRPVFATVLSLILLLLGGRAYIDLPTRLYPKVDATTINVTVTYSGADAGLMEGFVTTPIENAIAGVDGIDYMISQSQQGKSTITVYFDLGYDINAAMADVNAKVSSVRSQLPKDIDDPVVAKYDPNATPSMYINFMSSTLSRLQITDYLARVAQPQMQTLPGVSQAQIYGPLYAMRIWLNPYAMAAQSVTPDDITYVLENNNLQSPSGPIKGAVEQINIKSNTDLLNEQQFNEMVIKDVNGHLVRIKDVGRAELGQDTYDITAFYGLHPTIVLAITPGPTANPLDVSNEIRALMPVLAKTMPAGIDYSIMWDNSIYIDKSIEEVKHTIVVATICVIVIVFLFLGSFRVLSIPLVTIPLSLIGVCFIMLAMGYSLNTMTYLALVLAIGMVVDDAIVVSENIHRHMAEGKSPIDAAIVGAREIQFAVISMTLTLAAVYAPIGFQTGLIGSLFKEFAFTLAAAVVISGFVAITLSPMMCSKIITPTALSGRLATIIHNIFEKVMHKYRAMLNVVLNWRSVVVVVMAVFLISSYFLFKIIPRDFVPREDIGGLQIAITAPTSASLPYTESYTNRILPIINQYPENNGYILVNGYKGVNTAFALFVLKPWDERKRTAQEIVKDLYPKLWGISGVKAFPVIPSLLPGAGSLMPINISIQSTGDYQEINAVMQKILAAAAANPGLTNIDSDLKMDQVQVDVHIDRNKAGDMGIAASSIGNAIKIALSEGYINRFSILGRSYKVIPELELEYRNHPELLNLIYVSTKSGELVPLSNLLTLQDTLQPQSLNHFQQLRSATITASMVPGYTIGQAVTYLQNAMAKIVPEHMTIDYGGETRQYVQAGNAFASMFSLALVIIYLILAAQFESFRDPLIVIFTVACAVFGALLVMIFTKTAMSIYSQIGLVTLVGLITKHGILMVEFANQLQEQGRGIREAIIEAAAIRLRPVLMTTGAMVLGAVPLAMASGAGMIARQQIGHVIVGGMTIGTLFTLFVVPTMYTLLATKKTKIEE